MADDVLEKEEPKPSYIERLKTSWKRTKGDFPLNGYKLEREWLNDRGGELRQFRFEADDSEQRITWSFSGSIEGEGHYGVVQIYSSIGPFNEKPPNYGDKTLNSFEAVRAKTGLLATLALARTLVKKDFTHTIIPNKSALGFAKGLEELGYRSIFDTTHERPGWEVKITEELAEKILKDFGRDAAVPVAANRMAKHIRALRE